jgi:hypothetical protein
MKKGYLSQYFEEVAAKTLKDVEVNILVSHQHEFNGVAGLRKMLGEPKGKVKYETKFIYLTDYEDNPLIEDGILTWYDARENHATRTEYRLYFPSNQVLQCASTGDILIIAKRPDNTLLAIIAEKETTIASQVIWLFGITDIEHPGFSIREELETEQDRIEFASRFILESIGIQIETTEETYLDEMLQKFGPQFPATRIFSEYARSTLKDIDSSNDPDNVLLAYMEREEILFRTLEKHIIGERLNQGFNNDVDKFISYSLSVQNRRKSRAGLAFENHLEYIIQSHKIKYSRTPVTENKSKPDFLFPGENQYHDQNFNAINLTMLGVKSTLKDRWRQVLAEADRIEEKHLLTLEAAISTQQTDEMNSKKLQLIIPEKIQSSYTSKQQNWLMNVEEFFKLLKIKQRAAGL